MFLTQTPAPSRHPDEDNMCSIAGVWWHVERAETGRQAKQENNMIEIRISGAGTEGIFDQIRQHTHAEVEADCVPSGYEIIVGIACGSACKRDPLSGVIGVQ